MKKTKYGEMAHYACPNCSSGTDLVNPMPTKDGLYRLMRCRKCVHTFTTKETLVSPLNFVDAIHRTP